MGALIAGRAKIEFRFDDISATAWRYSRERQ
jgi:hypothetical protein